MDVVLKKMPLVLVEWEDACATNHGWQSRTHYHAETSLLKVRTVGHLFKKTSKYVTVVQSHDAGQNVDGAISIPRANIMRMRTL